MILRNQIPLTDTLRGTPAFTTGGSLANLLARITVLSFLAILFLVPKANLFYPTSSYVGVKPDDLAFGCLALVALLVVALAGFRDRFSWMLVLLAVTFLGISVLAGGTDDPVTRILYVGRYASYIACLPLGLVLARRLSMSDGIRIARFYVVATLVTVCYIVLQSSGVIGGFLNGVWVGDVTSRPVGQTSHPTEAAAFLVLTSSIAIVLARRFLLHWRVYAVLVFITAVAGVWVTESRSSIIAMFLAFMLPWLFSGPVIRRAVVCLCVLIFVTLATLDVIPTTALLDSDSRVLQVLEPESFVPVFGMLFASEVDLGEKPEGVDPSLYARLFKWRNAIADFERSPIWGHGAGSVGPALDGFYLRVLVESGVVGLAAFVGLILTVTARISKSIFRGPIFRRMVVTTLLIGVFIDIFFFARFAYLFWFSLGLLLGLDEILSGQGKRGWGGVPSPSPEVRY